MNQIAGSAAGTALPRRPAWSSRLFRATAGQFERAEDRSEIDRVVAWVEDRYREELAQRPSKHVYLRTLPAELQRRIDRLRDHPAVIEAILRQFGAGWSVTPMKSTDELYISHYNKDYGGDHGLYGSHYDGNLRFLPLGAVVRSLIYLQSDGTYKVVFRDSGLARAFRSYDFALLDFHRELHWVEGEYDPADRQRILLKCNYLVAPKNAALLTRLLLAANQGVFYLVKAAMEYSKSPRTPAQRAVGLVCNLMRVLNNVHPLVPIALVAALAAALGRGIVALLA